MINVKSGVMSLVLVWESSRSAPRMYRPARFVHMEEDERLSRGGAPLLENPYTGRAPKLREAGRNYAPPLMASHLGLRSAPRGHPSRPPRSSCPGRR